MRTKFPALYVVICLALAPVCLSQPAPLSEDLEASKRAYRQGDYAAALKQLRPLAERGNAEAQVVLGTMNLKGQGVTRDSDRALKWYRAAAEQGNAEGQFFAGSMYLMGAGVAHDTAQGMRWLGLSADQGNSDSQVLLGLVYLQGHDGVPRDLVQADLWFQLAATRGDPLAPREIVAVEKQMTPEEIVKAKASVAAWKPKSPPATAESKKD